MGAENQFSGTTWFQKLKLLIWKNYRIQFHNKAQTFLEIFAPLIFILALAWLRIVLKAGSVEEPAIFTPFDVKTIPGVLKTSTNKIFYTPDSPYWKDVMGSVKENYFSSRRLTYSFEGFASESEMTQAYMESLKGLASFRDLSKSTQNISSPVLGGVVFPTLEPNENTSRIDYSLRFPAFQRTEFDIFVERQLLKPSWFTDTLYPLFITPGPRAALKNNGGFPGYFAEGFLYLQNAIESTIIKTFLNDSQTQELEEYKVQLQRFPYPPYTKDRFIGAQQVWLCFFLVFGFIYPAMNLTKMIVHEKECRLKEYMKIMGLPNWLHWTAWFLKAITSLGLAGILIVAFTKIKFGGERSILTESDSTIIFGVLLCHGITLIAFCFFLSTLFAKASTATTAAGFLWVITYIPYGFFFPRLNSMTRLSKSLSCLFLGNMPLSYASYIFAMFESTSTGVQWGNIMEGVTPDDSFSILDCMMLMLFNSGITMVAAFYIELVWPGKYGVPLPWYFPFTKWYWTDGIQEKIIGKFEQSSSTGQKKEYFEAEPLHLKAGIDLRGLTKIFKEKTAVNNLSLRFYEHQVTALLGHNGAGKTTTMAMLTGFVTPTSGTAIVNGFDICKDMTAVRASLGLCPQYNVLFDELTVEEHIQFFAMLKGCTAAEADTEAQRMIQILGFESKRQSQACTLSGGMKRKLSVGIAFCAGSKAVLLDEPTSGMDPGARRSTWDLIQKEKLNRTVILSTHYMEEADLLGDRIAIMADGAVKCCGCSLFLKKKYGGFHRLIIVKQPDCIPSKITEFLQSRVPTICKKDDVGAELTYSLPDEHSHDFPALFEDLDLEKDQLGVVGFGVSNASMEEVFMRIGELITNEENSENIKCRSREQKPMLKKRLVLDGPHYEGLQLMMHQMKAVCFKKIKYISRNFGLALLQIIIPVSILGLSMMCFNSMPGLSTPSPHTMSLDEYENLGHTVITTSCEDNNNICDGYQNFVVGKYEVETIQNRSLQDVYLDKASRDLRHFHSKYMIGLEQSLKNTSRGVSKHLVAFFNNQPYHTPSLALNYMSNGILRGFGVTTEISVTNHPFDHNDADKLKQAGNIFTLSSMAGWEVQFALGIMGASFCIFPTYERIVGAKHLQFVAGLKPFIYWAGSFMIDIVNFMLASFLMLMVLVVLGIEQFQQWDIMMWCLLLCLAHGWCLIAMTSLFSFAFTVPSTGFARMTLLNSGTGIITIATVFILQTPEFGLFELARTVHDVFVFCVPNYALGMGIAQVTMRNDLKGLCQNFNLESMCKLDKDFICCRLYQENVYAWEITGIGKNLVSLFVSGLIFYFGVFIIESDIVTKVRARFPSFRGRNIPSEDSDASKDLLASCDTDVATEAKRINGQRMFNHFKTDNLIMRNLTKVYNSKVTAVKGLSLGVAKGETFGLLGVNGAGKTTLFKMITGDISITTGDVYLCKNSVRKNLSEVYKKLGYCPQFDALIEQLTGRETIRMFANLRGIKGENVNKIVDSLAQNLLFAQHIDKKVGDYSGGNKRKLSTAVAMLGNPPVVFLDEPTTGLDPVARRHVWNAVSRLRESGTSVVITSHSMEECEALCSRLAIMVDGSFQCLGSPQHLKNKFGDGYTVVAQLRYSGRTSDGGVTHNRSETGVQDWEQELQGLKNFIKRQFPDCELKDSHPGFVQYYVPVRNAKWAKLFAAMEVAKEEFKLEAYSVGQTSLEQVFFNFTTGQKSAEI
ncbi:unnamed protein product [Allacma fusca]|uniref:ABC transporter domain-containing protein n=1 Tax=Allacma fusca TaxID=39272 RepID=A0A8J2L2I5_9HEXA|nr:unnamed protein product [Allacma fusca]